jgi:O-acetylserine/cysteine efflux transporter
MSFRHLLITLLVVALWGFNFIFIKMALNDFQPLTLVAIRFFLTAIPWVFFIPRPRVSWKLLVAYGFVNFALQFGFLFSAMHLGMSPALSSMIVQTQVFFTMALAVYFFKERPNFVKIGGAIVAFSGVAFVGLHSGHDVSLPGLLLLLCGGFSWAWGNILSKKIGSVHAVALVVWGGLFACPFLIFTALFVEGPVALLNLQNISVTGLCAVAYIVYASTHLAYSLWAWLLNKYNASSVVPFTLLVPVFGFASSALVLNEEIPDWKIYAAILVVSGLGINIYGSRRS